MQSRGREITLWLYTGVLLKSGVLLIRNLLAGFFKGNRPTHIKGKRTYHVLTVISTTAYLMHKKQKHARNIGYG